MMTANRLVELLMIANGRNLIFDLATRRVARSMSPPRSGRDLTEDVTACEQSLIEGLDAIRWIRRADETMRAGDYEGIFDYSEPLQASMKKLLDDWMQKATSALKSAEEFAARGAVIPHVEAFREAYRDVECQIASGELAWPDSSPVFQDEPW